MLTSTSVVLALICDALRWLQLTVRSNRSIKAENLFLRRQLALYIERGVRPRRIDPVTRLRLAALSRLFAWQKCTGHRASGNSASLAPRHVEAAVATEVPARQTGHSSGTTTPHSAHGSRDPRWGEERIANVLLLKLGIQISPRTVRKNMPHRPAGHPRGDLRWSTFLRPHAQRILACDFCLAVTASFRMLYVFVVIEHKNRRLVHCNVTAHPMAAWTLQQLREVVDPDHRYQFLLHDRDCIFSRDLDDSIRSLGIKALRSAPHCPKMNAICEHVIGTLRRECLDWLVPPSESHLRTVLRSWVTHYNRGRPHMALEPGVPDPPIAALPSSASRHRLGESYAVQAEPILGGLHHEYHLIAA